MKLANDSRLYTEQEVSKRFGCSVELLRKWRRNHTGPSYHRLGKLIRYSETSIDSWLDEHRVDTTGGR
jgi:predicted DNA-binding transcriptional regulator AlpA